MLYSFLEYGFQRMTEDINANYNSKTGIIKYQMSMHKILKLEGEDNDYKLI